MPLCYSSFIQYIPHRFKEIRKRSGEFPGNTRRTKLPPPFFDITFTFKI